MKGVFTTARYIGTNYQTESDYQFHYNDGWKLTR